MVFYYTFIKWLDRILSSPNQRRRKLFYLTWTWLLTFMIYTSYHMSRKPISVVKNVLNENCSKLTPPSPQNDSHWCDWKPFNTHESSTLLGVLDSAYLFTYAISMFFSGMIAERSSMNVFLATGMILSGILTALFGLGYTFHIHAYWYYLLVQLLSGFVQSSGWPGVVTVMGNWFGKKRRGFIMGIWNSHTSLGNILGTLIAGHFLISGWDLSFVVPGCIIAGLGLFVLFFLIPDPRVVDLPCHYDVKASQIEDGSVSDYSGETSSLLENEDQIVAQNIYEECISEPTDQKPISFTGALAIPGVVEFSMCLFFAKLVSYTFLYWLPHFIFDSTDSNADESGKVSTFFDLGGIVGGILAGIVSDMSGMPASTCCLMLIAAVPVIFVYQGFAKSVSLTGNILLLLPVGLLVNGPYALITTAVSAELGTHSSLRGNAKALSTVTSIIDGTGSLGAAIGPLLAGALSNDGNWSRVFYMLMMSDILALVFLVRLTKREIMATVRSFMQNI